MTPKTPESFRNEWNYRDFWRKGQWLEFLKTSALDQLEASILAPPNLTQVLESLSFLSFQPHSGNLGVFSEKQSYLAVISFISSFSHLSLIPIIPKWCEWVFNDTIISASFRQFGSHFWEAVSFCSNFFPFLIFPFLPHSTDSRMILPSFLSFVCHYWLSKLIHHQILGAWALGSFCQKAWTRSLSSLDWLLAYWMTLNECRLRLNEIEGV